MKLWKFSELKQVSQEPMQPDDIDAIVQAELEIIAEDLAEREGVLEHIIVKQGGKPTPQQISLFASKWNWEVGQHVRIPQRGQKLLWSELARKSRVVRNQMEAGDAETRKQAQEAAKAARKRADLEGPKLDEQIAELQAKRESLYRDAERRERLIAEANAACERLRELVPSELRTIADRLRGEAKRNSNTHELEGEIAHLNSIVALEPGSDAMLKFCDSLAGDHPCKRKAKEGVDGVAWDAFQADAKQRLKKLKPIAEAARAKLDEALAESREILDFYIR